MTPALSCKDLELLKARLHADIRVYGDFAARLILETGAEFDKAYQRAQRAKHAYERSRQILNQHAAEHHCETEI